MADAPPSEAPARTGTGMALAREALGPQAHFVRGIYFDKSPQTNGYVTWHQDRKIAVEKRVSIPGWGPWSRKDGRWHVQPPIDWLERMIAVRLHLDDAGERSGGLRPIAGSHRNGLLATRRIADLVHELPPRCPSLCAGDALLMHPLLLHALSRIETPCHRRVLHFEYCALTLPEGLNWAT